jgi:hypothetical protein
LEATSAGLMKYMITLIKKCVHIIGKTDDKLFIHVLFYDADEKNKKIKNIA